MNSELDPTLLERRMMNRFRKAYLDSMSEYEFFYPDLGSFRLHVNQQMLGLIATICAVDENWPKDPGEQVQLFDRHMDQVCEQGKKMFRDLMESDGKINKGDISAT